MNDVGDISKPESSDDAVGEVIYDCLFITLGGTFGVVTLIENTGRILLRFSRLRKRKAAGDALVFNDVGVTG